MRQSRSVSLRDVAERAGIGVATASTVLNGSRSNIRVSDATRARVLEVAREMDYQPNAIARALKGQPTKTLGVLFGVEGATVAVANSYVFTVWQGIIASAEAAGYNVTVFTEMWRGAARSSGMLRDGRADGIIAIAVTTDSDIATSLVEVRIPLVVIGSVHGGGVLSVDTDNVRGTELAMTHLVGLGHTRIAHLAGRPNLSSAIERRVVFHRELIRAGLPDLPEFTLPGSFEPGPGYDYARRLLSLPSRPTAIFAANDTLALAAIEAAKDLGLSVPGDLSVVGFDDRPIAAVLSAGLTTVRQPLMEIGATGAEMLISQLEGRDPGPTPRIFEPNLVIRHSTAPPRAL